MTDTIPTPEEAAAMIHHWNCGHCDIDPDSEVVVAPKCMVFNSIHAALTAQRKALPEGHECMNEESTRIIVAEALQKHECLTPKKDCCPHATQCDIHTWLAAPT